MKRLELLAWIARIEDLRGAVIAASYNRGMACLIDILGRQKARN
jgi:hypothetical protein